MCKYSLETIRKKAYEAGYEVSKGFQPYLVQHCLNISD